MKTITRITIVFALTLGAAGTIFAAEDSRVAESQPAATRPVAGSPIQFEVVDKAWGLAPDRPAEASHVVKIVIGHQWNPVQDMDWTEIRDGLLRTPTGQAMSERQRAMMQKGRGILDYTLTRSGGTRMSSSSPSGVTMNWLLLAVSEDDARKLAQALVEYLNGRIRSYAEQDGHRELQEKREALRKDEKALEEAMAKKEPLTKELQEMRKTVAYRSRDDASQDKLELDKALRSVDVDLAAIQAKTDTIKKLQDQVRAESRTSLLPALDQMMFAQDIDRAGALARKAALERQRKAAERYDYLVGREIAENLRVDENRRNLRQSQQVVAELENRLKPVEVVGKATIHPAEFHKPLPVMPPSGPQTGSRP